MAELLHVFGDMIPLSILALCYAFFAWPVLTAHRARIGPRRHASATAALDVTLCTFGALVLRLATMQVGTSHESILNLAPGTDLVETFSCGSAFWQTTGNLLLLVPLGALLPLRVPALRSLLRVMCTAMATSTAIEGTQYLIHVGRVTSTDDVILNTVGATLGAALTRRAWRVLDRLGAPEPAAIPVQRRRTICTSPPRTLRVPRSVWDTRYATCPNEARTAEGNAARRSG
ncbi:VanZ family protein [Amycolatopsis sp. NPDC059027]|uniref:VanZ family protein n=1 Tax=unclassified Amycolatopsis TaxID=2618356 RepID=UPI00366C3BFC